MVLNSHAFSPVAAMRAQILPWIGSSPAVCPRMTLSFTTSGAPVKLQLHFLVSRTCFSQTTLPVFWSRANTRPSRPPK